MSLSGYNMAWRMLGAEVHLSWLTAILTQIIALYAFAMLKLLNLGLLLVTYVGVLLFVVLLILLLWGGVAFSVCRHAHVRSLDDWHGHLYGLDSLPQPAHSL